MTIVNQNSTSHSGLLVTGTGDDIDIDVELVGGRTLRMSAAGDELGAWPIDDCHIEPDPDRLGTFRIIVDGDDAVFTPVDPAGFRALIEKVTGAEFHDAEPDVEGSSDSVAAAADPATSPGPEAVPGNAADDPVAFLFGSAQPPTPRVPAPEAVAAESDNHHTPPTGPDLDASAPTDEDALDTELEPSDLDDVGFDWDDEIEVSVEPRSAYSPAEGAEEDEDVSPLAADVPPPVVSPVLAARLEEAERLEAGGDEESFAGAGAAEPDGFADTADVGTDRARFGALDRLSEAISSVTSTSRPTVDDTYELGPNNVADEVLTSQRALRDHRVKGARRAKRLKVAAIAGVLVGLVALIALLAPGAIEFIQNYEGDAAPPPTLAVTETTVVTPPTTVPEDVPVPDSSTSTTLSAELAQSVFALPAPQFVARWDSAATIVDEVLEFDSNPIVGPFQEQFTPYLSFLGEVQPDGRLSGFSLVVDPAGPSEYDRIGIQALGVAVATVEPDRSPQGRAALIGELGLNVREPQLGGIDGSVESAGLQYTLVYDAETTLLTLTVAPAG